MSFSAVIFLVAFAAGSVAAISRRPVYGLMTYVGVFYIHPPSRWWGQGLLFEVRWALLAAGVALLSTWIHRPAGPTAQVTKSGAFWGLVFFIAWISIQTFWAADGAAHAEFLSYYLKFLVVVYLFCRCIETEQDLRLILWSHVLGCFYLGWIAYTSYGGGRFEGFGGPGINEANAASMQLVTGIIVAGALFLASGLAAKALLVGILPFIVNAVVATISRSGFLAAAVGGLIFNLFTPARYRVRVGLASILGLVLFAMLTNPIYWARMATLKYKGEDIQGVDTGDDRLELMDAQWRMFTAHPLGCGHMCTTYLSPSYLDAARLSEGARSSHNTFMTMLVDHGIPGGLLYLAMLIWIARGLLTAFRRLRGTDGLLPVVLPALAAVFAAITVGDLFVQYPKFEARFWFVSLLIVLLHLSEKPRPPGVNA